MLGIYFVCHIISTVFLENSLPVGTHVAPPEYNNRTIPRWFILAYTRSLHETRICTNFFFVLNVFAFSRAFDDKRNLSLQFMEKKTSAARTMAQEQLCLATGIRLDFAIYVFCFVFHNFVVKFSNLTDYITSNCFFALKIFLFYSQNN